jgi:hypothetical protein
MKIAALSTVVIYDIICKADVVIAAEDDDTEGSLTMNLLLSIIQHHWYHHISIFFFNELLKVKKTLAFFAVYLAKKASGVYGRNSTGRFE